MEKTFSNQILLRLRILFNDFITYFIFFKIIAMKDSNKETNKCETKQIFDYSNHFNNVKYCLPSFFLIKDDYKLYNKKVLDVWAWPWQYLQFFWKDSLWIEISDKNIESIRNLWYNADKIDLNIFPYKDLNKYWKFDIVFSSHVIEHLYSPILFIWELTKYLKDDGKIIIWYPTRFSLVRLFDPYFSLKEMHHLYDFGLTWIKVLLKANWLEIEKIYYDIPFAWRSKFFNWIQKIVQPLPYWMVSRRSHALYIVARKK